MRDAGKLVDLAHDRCDVERTIGARWPGSREPVEFRRLVGRCSGRGTNSRTHPPGSPANAEPLGSGPVANAPSSRISPGERHFSEPEGWFARTLNH
jgi:hypothetical protein